MLLKRAQAIFAALCLACANAHADGVSEGQELARQAIAASEKGDHATAADLLHKAQTFRPNHPSLTYRYAKESALAGRTGEAIQALGDYAAMGLTAKIETDADFASLATDTRFANLRVQFARNAEPKGTIAIAATIAEPAILAEGIAFDSAQQRLYVGSVRKRKIVVVGQNAQARDFVSPAAHGLYGAFGLALDTARGSLWAASSALPQTAALKDADKGRAGIFEFALAGGKLKQRLLLARDGKEHVIGDLTLSPAGDVYASDSSAPVVYRLAAGGNSLEPFVTGETFHSLQGLALSPDATKLAVADYSAGIHVIDVATRAVAQMRMPAHTTLHGIDALVRYGRDLIGVQNGIEPQRVVLVRMNADWTEVEGLDVLAANLPQMDEPTLATLDGDDLLVVGNGQWSRFADDGSIKGDQLFAPTRIVRLKLPLPRS